MLVQRLAAETKTKGGVLIPEKSQAKVLEATVVAVGPGRRADVSVMSTVKPVIYGHCFEQPPCFKASLWSQSFMQIP